MVARSLSRFSLSSTRVSGWRDGGCPCLAACGWKERRGERLAVRLRGSEPLLQVRARVPAGRGGLGGQALPRDGAVGAHALARRARRDGRPGGGGWIVGPLAARGDRLCRGQHAALLRHRARGAAGAGTPLVMICLPPQSTPPHTHSSRHGPQHTQHTASTAATPHYPQGRRQTPADAPTPLKRSMLTPFGGPRPLHDMLILRGCCARINHPFIPRVHLHCPPWCNTIARLLGSIRLPFRPFACMLYTIHYW